jgi:uncharacterized protein
MKIAIIGSGIAGSTLAYHLHPHHEVTVFESGSHIGGHTHTHDIEVSGEKHSVDTGFIVFNDRTYPNFIELLEKLDVAWQPSNMSFSVKDETTGLEYNGTTLNSLFAQRRNLFSPSFYRMIKDILRFNKSALALLGNGSEIKLGDYLTSGKYSPQFIKHYIIPMGAAIWSTDAQQMMNFPARFFVRFFHHHGMLSVNDRPQWRTIKNGSKRYMDKLTHSFKSNILLNAPITHVKRLENGVKITPLNQTPIHFDYVFFACHSDEALNILGEDATENERQILGAIPYQENTVYLHQDITLMPKSKLAWAAWNYHVTEKPSDKVLVTYNMNILQNLQSKQPLLVTLNHTDNINPDKVIKRLKYMHPVFTIAGTLAQSRHSEISGHYNTGYAGAYWRNGFHEDGVVSALEALKHFETFTRAQ